MAVKKANIKKPELPVEEVLISALADEPVKVRCLLQTQINTLSEEQKQHGGVDWSVILAHKSVVDDDLETIFTVEEWAIWQAAHRVVLEEQVVPALLRVNGFDRDNNKKK